MPAHPLFMGIRRLFDQTEPHPGHSRVWHTSCRYDQIKEAVFRRNRGAKQPLGTILKVYLPHFGRQATRLADSAVDCYSPSLTVISPCSLGSPPAGVGLI